MSLSRIVAACLLLAGSAVVVRAQVDIDDLKPGLVATYTDGAKTEVVRTDPMIGINWKAGETVHPRLAPDGNTVVWDGYLNVLRAGNYKFSARVRGELTVTIAGKNVLKVSGKDDLPALQAGAEVRLEGGPQPLTVKFTRPDGAGRAELFWQSSWFRPEPVPYDAFFHNPAKTPAALATNQTLERGRFLAEELNCIGCHRPAADDKMAKGLVPRLGPDLSLVGGRVNAGWIYHWLGDPQKWRANAAMPKVFADNEAGKTEQYAVAQYLASLTGPAKPAPKPPDAKAVAQSVKAGQALFGSVGCTACHQTEKGKAAPQAVSLFGDPRVYVLDNIGSKATAEAIAAFISNPHAIDPSGRMPNLLLDGKEALDIARFLTEEKDKTIPEDLPAAPADGQRLAVYKQLKPTAEEQAAFDKLKPEDQWLSLGQRLVIERGCNNCHNVAPAGKALPTHGATANFDQLKSGKTLAAGCLSDDAAKRGAAPTFALDAKDKAALRAFLGDGVKGPGSPSPTNLARVTYHRFNCLGCHSRNGKGGLSSEMTEELRKFEKAENAEAVVPPPLTGTGHKLRTPWLKSVLLEKGRARPWMSLRMPQFGDKAVGHLPEAFAYLEGAEPDDTVHKAAINAANVDNGKHLVGKNAFGCISCHDLAGIPNTGTRGPDLAYMNQRVRYDWYLSWLEQAQRMHPGTRMPTVFPDGKSSLPTVLGGDAQKQADAMWAYLSLGPTLPLPVGLEPNIKGRILAVADKPVMLRCFAPEVGAKSIAVGYPGGVNVMYDAAACRVGYAWSGAFLDVSPLWDNRGGTPVKLLGQKFLNLPQGHPWALNDGKEPPDFAAQAKDLAWGIVPPTNKVFAGVKQLQFLGYSMETDGSPTFRYRIHAGESEPGVIAEKIEPLRTPVAVGVRRTFTISLPANKGAWLLAGETPGTPLIVDANDTSTNKFEKFAEIKKTDVLVQLPQAGDKVVLLKATAPAGSSWYLQRQGAGAQAMLRLPATSKAQDVTVTLDAWAPYRAEPGLYKELLTAK